MKTSTPSTPAVRMEARCPRCGGLFALNASGALLLHSRLLTHYGRARCEGSGHKVTAADVAAWRDGELARARDLVEQYAAEAKVAAERLAAAEAELPAKVRAIERAAAKVRT